MLIDLDARNAEQGGWNVVIETPRGSRNKYEYDPECGLFRLARVLPPELPFPFDFGFVPSTLAENGDPLDVLVLVDEPTFAGCLVPVRLLGVIEAEHAGEQGLARSDRLVAVAQAAHAYRGVDSLDQLAPGLLDEVERFFISSGESTGQPFKPVGRRGPDRAEQFIQESTLRYQSERGTAVHPAQTLDEKPVQDKDSARHKSAEISRRGS